MANVTITDLPVYPIVTSPGNDCLPIVDITNNTTKKITVAQLLAGVPQTAVTSVGLAAPAAFNISGSPVTSSGTLTLSWGSGVVPTANLGAGTPNTTTFLRGDGQWQPVPPSGTVTSVGFSAPSPFTVSNSPITSAGNITLTWGTGQIPVANLGSGSASSSVFLAGDGVWRSPGGGGTVLSITAGTGLGAPTTGAIITATGTIQLLAATSTTIGGVKQGANTTIDTDGTISVTYPTLDQVLAQGASSSRTASIGALAVGSAPVANTDVVRLSDLQLAVQANVQFRPSVSLVSVNSVGTTYTNGSGVGSATITGTAPLVIDSITPIVNDRVLLINQGVLTGAASNVSNGAYTVTANPASGSFTLTRTSDPLVYGNYHFVTNGTIYINNSYILNTSGTITVGTTPISYVQFATNPSGALQNPKASGSANPGTSTRFAREDHVHPFSVTTASAASSTSLTYNSTTGVLTFTPATPGAGAVTSVGLSADSAFTVSGSPVTSSGTLNLAWGSGKVPSANLGAGTPGSNTFLAGDQQWRTVLTGFSATGVTPIEFTVTSPNSTPSLTTAWGTGQVPVANLGTGTASSTKYLRGDGSWQNAVATITANGVTPLTLTVDSTTTTSPSITASWGSGQIPVANLGSGTSGTTKYLRGDGTWQSFPSGTINYDASSFTFTNSGFTTSSAGSAGATSFTTSGTFTAGNNIAFTNANPIGGIYTVSGQSGTTVNFSPALLAADAFVSGTPIWRVTGALSQLAISDLVIGANLTASTQGSVLTIAGTGSVSSVALVVPSEFSLAGSPITGSGTITISKATQSANYFYAGPSSGAAGAVPTFRQIVAADLGSGTASSSTYLKGDLTWGSLSGAGTVTSVALTAPSDFSVSGSPITSSGTIAITYANQSPNRVLAGPSSGSTTAAPSYRALVALDLATGGSATNFLRGDMSWQAITVPDFSVLNSPVTSRSVETNATSTATASALTVDTSTGSSLILTTLSGTTTITFSNITNLLKANGQAVTFAIIATQSATTNFINAVAVTGQTITTRWRGGTAPTAGNSAGFDVYQFTIVRSTAGAYTVLASINGF